MHHTDFRETWAARLAAPTEIEDTILGHLAGASRGPETLDGYCHALFIIREHWTGPEPVAEPDGDVSITGSDLSLADLEQARSSRQTGLGPNGRRVLADTRKP